MSFILTIKKKKKNTTVFLLWHWQHIQYSYRLVSDVIYNGPPDVWDLPDLPALPGPSAGRGGPRHNGRTQPGAARYLF